MHYYIYVFINSHHAFRCDQIYIETLPYYNDVRGKCSIIGGYINLQCWSVST